MAVEGSWPELLPWGQLRTQSPSKTQLFLHSLQESREQAQLSGFTARLTEEAGDTEQSALEPEYPPRPGLKITHMLILRLSLCLSRQISVVFPSDGDLIIRPLTLLLFPNSCERGALARLRDLPRLQVCVWEFMVGSLASNSPPRSPCALPTGVRSPLPRPLFGILEPTDTENPRRHRGQEALLQVLIYPSQVTSGPRHRLLCSSGMLLHSPGPPSAPL